MKLRTRRGGYSTELAKEIISDSKSVISLSTELEPQYVWDKGHRTDQISGFQAWFAQEDLGAFKIKFEHEVKLPPFLSEVDFVDLEACQVRNNVYFKAKDIN